MNNLKIYFSHGKDSEPNGYKISYLTKIVRKNGFEYESIDYRITKNPDERVEILLNSINNSKNIILYGSSMGAYVSLVASKFINPKGLFLCAPALYLPNYQTKIFSKLNIPITIIHGYNDDIVSYKNSVKFAEYNKCNLHIVNDGHSLANSKSTISFLFKEFLDKF